MGERGQVDPRGEVGIFQQGFSFRGENQGSVGSGGVIKRLNSKAVPHQVEDPGLTIPEGEGEGAAQPGGAFRPHLFKEVDNYLQLFPGSEAVPPRLEFSPQLPVIVNPPVAYQAVAPRFIGQRFPGGALPAVIV